MSTQPTQPPPTQPYYGTALPPLPAPNGELVIFALVWLVAFIVTLAADEVGWSDFLLASVVLASFYMLSRGIAKAGKVFEGR
jgi:hypothetical protein